MVAVDEIEGTSAEEVVVSEVVRSEAPSLPWGPPVDSDPTVTTTRTRGLVSWPYYENVRPDALADLMPLSEALITKWPTDRYIVQYHVPEFRRRLSNGLFDEARYPGRLASIGGVVRLQLLFIEVDSPKYTDADGQTTRGDVEAWWADVERPKVVRFLEAYPGLCAFRTKNGYRIFGRLWRTFELRSSSDTALWRAFYLEVLERLARDWTIVGDPKCADWGRHQGLPSATRMGSTVPEDRETLGDPRAVGVWDLSDVQIDVSKVVTIVSRWDGPGDDAVDFGPADKDVIERARARLLRHGPAIEREFGGPGGGDTHTVQVGAILLNDFALEWDEAWPLALEWNGTCQGRWEEDELAGKLSNGGGYATGPRGSERMVSPLVLGIREALRAQGLYPPEPDDGEVEVPADLGPGSAGNEEGLASDESDDLLTRSMQSSLSGKPKGAPPKPTRKVISDIDEMSEWGQGDLAGDLDERKRLYQRAGALVQVAIDGRPKEIVAGSRRRASATIRRASVNDIRARMSSQAQWYQSGDVDGNKPKKDKNCMPPREVAERIHSIGSWRVPMLHGVCERPLLRPDGTFLDRNGFDPVTATFVDVAPGLEDVVASIPDAIDEKMAARAAEILLEPFREFPFVTRHHKAAFLAFVCTLVCRSAIDGNVMYFGVSGPQPNLGKTLLFDSGTAIATGQFAEHTPQCDDEKKEELEMQSFLLEGCDSIIVDNVTRQLGGRYWDVYATSRTMPVRLFHTQTMARVPADAVISFTGKNIRLHFDMQERLLQVKLESDVPNPGDRVFKMKEQLKTHVLRRRAELMVAAFTIVAGYLRAGSPDVVGEHGKFPEWNAVIRSAVRWGFGIDPCAGMRTDNESSDERTAESHGLLLAWMAAFPEKKVTSKELIAATDAHLRAGLEAVCGDQGRLDAKRLGQYLGSIKGRMFAIGGFNCKLERSPKPFEDGYRWHVSRTKSSRITNGDDD